MVFGAEKHMSGAMEGIKCEPCVGNRRAARTADATDTLLKSALAQRKCSRRVRLQSKDGRPTYQIRTVSPLNDRSGHLIGAFGVGTPCAG